jgi:hypothetical protein
MKQRKGEDRGANSQISKQPDSSSADSSLHKIRFLLSNGLKKWSKTKR